MDMSKLALVVGYDTSIIARESAKLLIENGYKIIAVCNNASANAENIVFIAADLFQKESVLALVKTLKHIGEKTVKLLLTLPLLPLKIMQI